MERTVGVLGGMGPEATADFFQKIIKLTPAGSDQEHLRIIVDNDPKTPDRTGYIVGNGEDPTNVLIERAIKLKLMGAELLAMPCNTAHYFYDEIVKYVDIPFINMIEEVAEEIKARHGKGVKVGLLATLGTYKAKVYEKVFDKHGIDIIIPGDEGKKDVYELIYKIKEDLNKADTDGISRVVKDLKSRGAIAIILGCTELPLVEASLPKDMEYIDATSVLAKKVVEMAMDSEL